MAWQGNKSRTSKPLQVQRRHLISTANRMGLGAEADPLVSDLVTRTPGVITAVRAQLPPRFPEQLAATILGGLQSSADQLLRQQTD
jgi:serine/threonine-protein kinase HipA